VSLPVALLGGVATAVLLGELSTLGALLGLLAVFGLAVRNAMSLIAHYRHLEYREGEAFSPELVRRGTRERFAPIVTTAIVAALAFLPIAFLGNIAGLEVLHSMAIVVLGGLVSSTFVSLFVVPSLYTAFGRGTDALDITAEEEAA
jgi:Cu/Ag efflux pump CusA